MINPNKYVVYATSEDGEGLTQNVGTYSDLSDINIHVGMFKDNVVISIADETEDDD